MDKDGTLKIDWSEWRDYLILSPSTDLRDILHYWRHSTVSLTESPHDKTNKLTFAPSEDSDQPGHPPSCPLSAMRRLSDWADAQADLSLRWVHRSFCWFCHEAAQFCFSVLCA